MLKSKNGWRVLLVVGGVVLIAAFVIIVMLLVPQVVPMWQASLAVSEAQNGPWTNPAAFGDMFGVANALFSGLAFGGVIVAIILQTRELGHQRMELTQTRFDSTFFHMLRLHHDIVAAVQIRHPGDATKSTQGRECFQEFLKELQERFKANVMYPAATPAACSALIESTYQEFFCSYQADLGHYFRNLYRIVKYVAESAPCDVKLYLGLLRAQLSSAELGLLFYNALSTYGCAKFKPLIEVHALLDNMPLASIASALHATLYAPSAFGRTPPVWLAPTYEAGMKSHGESQAVAP